VRDVQCVRGRGARVIEKEYPEWLKNILWGLSHEHDVHLYNFKEKYVIRRGKLAEIKRVVKESYAVTEAYIWRTFGEKVE